MPRRAVAAAPAAAVSPMSSTPRRSAGPAVRLTTSSTSGVAGPDPWVVSGRADCWVGQTTTVWPDFSGWKQSGTAEGLMNPRAATPTASSVITIEVISRTLRKLRTRSCSRRGGALVAGAPGSRPALGGVEVAGAPPEGRAGHRRPYPLQPGPAAATAL